MARSDESKHVDFVLSLLTPESALPSAIEWISENCQPQDVFSNEQLEAWARVAGFQRPS
jgi:hypothetical protein